MSRRKQLTEVAVVIVLIALVAWSFSLFVDKFRAKPEPRREIRHFMSRVKINDSKAQVQKKFAAAGYKHLSLRQVRPYLWSIVTPGEVGRNWELWIEYDKRDKVGALYLRITDSMSVRPREDAPPDIMRRGWKSAYPELRFSQ